MRQDVENFADFRQYYQGRWVPGRELGLIYYVGGPVDNTRNVFTAYVNGVAQDEVVLGEKEIFSKIQFGLPRIGMLAYQDELLYLYYRTSRNGSRGLGFDRVVTHSFNHADLQIHGLVSTRTLLAGRNATGALAHAVLWSKSYHQSLEHAYADLTAKRPLSIAYALAYQFGVYLRAYGTPVLCYRTHEIGEVLGPNAVKLYSRFVEYADLVKRHLGARLEVTIQ